MRRLAHSNSDGVVEEVVDNAEDTEDVEEVEEAEDAGCVLEAVEDVVELLESTKKHDFRPGEEHGLFSGGHPMSSVRRMVLRLMRGPLKYCWAALLNGVWLEEEMPTPPGRVSPNGMAR